MYLRRVTFDIVRIQMRAYRLTFRIDQLVHLTEKLGKQCRTSGVLDPLSGIDPRDVDVRCALDLVGRHHLCDIGKRNIGIPDFFRRKPLADAGDDLLQMDRLGQEIGETTLGKKLLRLRRGIRCECNHGEHPILALRSSAKHADSLNTIHNRHHVVHQDEVIVTGVNTIKRIPAVHRLVHLHLQRTEKLRYHLQIHRHIIYDQDIRLRCGEDNRGPLYIPVV